MQDGQPARRWNRCIVTGYRAGLRRDSARRTVLAMIEVEALSKPYGKFAAVRNLSSKLRP